MALAVRCSFNTFTKKVQHQVTFICHDAEVVICVILLLLQDSRWHYLSFKCMLHNGQGYRRHNKKTIDNIERTSYCQCHHYSSVSKNTIVTVDRRSKSHNNVRFIEEAGKHKIQNYV
jgi:hypothetical protein